MILVVLPALSEANLNTQSQSDVSQSHWIYWIYFECLGWLDCPLDTLLPGNIMDNALQSLCTSLLTHGLLPGVQIWNITAGNHGQVSSFCMERSRTTLDTMLQWAQCSSTELQGQEMGTGQPNHLVRQQVTTWAPASCMPFLHSKKEGGEVSWDTKTEGEM